MAGTDACRTVFRKMNATHLWYCMGDIAQNPALLVWMALFFAVGAALFVNTGFCTLSQFRLLGRRRARGQGKQKKSIQMTLIHTTALAVILLHAMDITLIRRHEPVRLYPGDTVQMGKYTVIVQKIAFVNDPAVIRDTAKGKKKKNFSIPAKNFSTEENLVTLQILTSDDPAPSGSQPMVRSLGMMAPVRVGIDYFFLSGFFLARGSEQIGVEIHHSTNPLAMVFFAVYAGLLFLLLLRYVTVAREHAPPQS